MNQVIKTVFLKEFKDGRRDKRALFSAFLFPVLAPVLVYFMLTAIIDLRNNKEQTDVPIIGADHAPELMQWLQERKVRLKDFDGDPRQAVRDQEESLVLVIPEDYQSRLAAFEVIPLTLVYDGSRTDAQSSIDKVRSLLANYNREVASLRLIVRGVSPQLMQVVSVQNTDIASKEEITATALNFIPLYIILAAFVSGMGLAVDSTAGERERKTLEPLLLNPVERYQLVAGKWFAASLFAAFGMLMTMLLCIAAMLRVPLNEIGLNFSISGQQILLMFLGMTPLALLATSLQMLLGMFAKSFKDAQSYIGLLTFLPVLPMMYTMFNPIATEDWMFSIPIFAQHLLLVEVLGAKTVPLMAYVSSAVSCLVLGAGVVMLTARLMQRENILAQ